MDSPPTDDRDRVTTPSMELDWVCADCGASLVRTTLPKGGCEWCGAPRTRFRDVNEDLPATGTSG